MRKLRMWLAPAGLALVVAIAIFAQAQAQAPHNFYFSALASVPVSPLGTYYVIDTGQTSGSSEIFQVVSVQNPTNPVQHGINGTGPQGSGDYTMAVIPGGDEEFALTSMFFYVSGL